MFNGFEILMVSKCDFFGVGNNPRGGILSSPVEKIMREAKKCSSTTKVKETCMIVKLDCLILNMI